MSVVDEIKDRIDIVELVGETVKLRKSGKNYTGFCPFHPNKRTPAFAVFPDSGTWRCFGACNEGGDIFNFVMKREGWDFPEALAYLAERAGVELEPRHPNQAAEAEALERLREVLEAAVTFYRHALFQTSAGKPALAYLRKRGLQDATLETFELGYAPDAWDALRGHLTERGFKQEDLVEAGLLSSREGGGYYDRFRNRIMFPIRDARGRMVGFGARTLDPQGVPKYLNSPQTPLFDKGRTLYGLDKARREIRRQDQAVIVEGYMDVIGLHQAGHRNAVSPMGTALSESQLRLLKRYSRRIILALDADAAGSQATLRGLEVARQALDREAEPTFDARGLIRYEGRLDADLRIVTLPEGQDPDELVLRDPEAWPNLLGQARTIVDYVMEVMKAERDLEDPKAKAEIAAAVLPLIEDVADPVERETYRQRLARALKVDERALLAWHPRRRQKRRAVGAEAVEGELEAVSDSSTAGVEGFCLAVLLAKPELLYRVDRAFQARQIERPSDADFTGAPRQILFRCLRDSLAQDEQEPAAYCMDSLDVPLQELAKSLMAQVEEVDPDSGRVLEELVANFLRLRQRQLQAKLNHLRYNLETLQEELAANDDEEKTAIWQLAREVQQIALEKDRLDRALSPHRGSHSAAIPR